MCLLTNYDYKFSQRNTCHLLTESNSHLLGDLTSAGLVFLIMWMRPLEKMAYFYCAWETVEWPDLNVASLSAGMRRRSLSHPWVLARITSDMIMFKGKAEWKRGRDRWGITSEESLSMTCWLPWQSVKRPISSACPSFPVVPSPGVSHSQLLRKALSNELLFLRTGRKSFNKLGGGRSFLF